MTTVIAALAGSLIYLTALYLTRRYGGRRVARACFEEGYKAGANSVFAVLGFHVVPLLKAKGVSKDEYRRAVDGIGCSVHDCPACASLAIASKHGLGKPN